MRVSNFEQYGRTVHHIHLLQSNLSQKLEQISTGKSFNRVSENPLGANQKMLVDQTYNRIVQFQSNIRDAKGFLEMNESNMASVEDILLTSRDIALKAANGIYDEHNMESFAKQIEQNIQQVVGLGNTKQLGKFMYSGEKTQTEPFVYDGTSVTYNGDSASVQYRVSTTVEMKVLDPGNKVFEGVINSLIDLRDQIRSGNKDNIEASLGNFDTQFDNVINMRSEIGTRLNSINTLNDIYESSKIDLDAKKEEIEGIDLTKTIMDFQSAQANYQGALQASVRVMGTTILNYI